MTQYIASVKTALEELILDVDATNDPTHGQQEARLFHGYYNCYHFHPTRVFCGQHLLCTLFFGVTRSFIVSATSITVSAKVAHYIVGLGRNARLQQVAGWLELAMKGAVEENHLKQCEIGEFVNAPLSWHKEHRFITRLDY